MQASRMEGARERMDAKTMRMLKRGRKGNAGNVQVWKRKAGWMLKGDEYIGVVPKNTAENREKEREGKNTYSP